MLLCQQGQTYLLCNLSIFMFIAWTTERLHVGDCLYKCWCVLKVSILMSTMRKNSIFQLLRACTQNHNHPSYSMPPALIKTTYNAYFSISHFTDSLTSLSNKFNIERHVLLLYPLLLCYHTTTTSSGFSPGGVCHTCFHSFWCGNFQPLIL